MQQKGYFIAVEGLDGSGKTTVSKELVKRLSMMGYRAVYTFEPYGSPFTEALRKYIELYGDAEAELEALVMALDRLYHIRRVVEPLLNEGAIVVCDRYLHSSIAYQGAKGGDVEWIKTINRYALKPDLVLYLRVPLEVALSRIRGKSGKWKYFESVERLKGAFEIYERLALAGELVPVDATASIEKVVEESLNHVLRLLGSQKT